MHEVEKSVIENRNIIEENGFLIDADTGEVLSASVTTDDKRWEPETPEDADWLLSKVADIDAEVLALNAKKQALCANIDKMIGRLESKRRSIEFLYGAQLRTILVKFSKGRKSLQLPHGKLQITASPGRNVITDADAALDWARQHAPNIIQRKEWVTVSAIKAVMPTEELPFISSTGPQEFFKMVSAIKVSPEATENEAQAE